MTPDKFTKASTASRIGGREILTARANVFNKHLRKLVSTIKGHFAGKWSNYFSEDCDYTITITVEKKSWQQNTAGSAVILMSPAHGILRYQVVRRR